MRRMICYYDFVNIYFKKKKNSVVYKQFCFLRYNNVNTSSNIHQWSVRSMYALLMGTLHSLSQVTKGISLSLSP